jgi:hypothetical protein
MLLSTLFLFIKTHSLLNNLRKIIFYLENNFMSEFSSQTEEEQFFSEPQTIPEFQPQPQNLVQIRVYYKRHKVCQNFQCEV